MEKKTRIGNKIKNKRLELNLRMDDVAKEVGITRATLSSIENGTGNYTIDALLKVVQFLNMSFDVESSTDTANRVRASRINSALTKRINRFIIMCVEQYAYSVGESSDATYRALKEKGIINELTNDYEDMHGMSTYSINEYIGNRLRGGAL